MLLGLISDTHGRLADGVLEAFEGVDAIIHAGDICREAILWELQSIAPVLAVYGNCDFERYSGVAGELKTTIDKTHIYVVHDPYYAEGAADSGEYDLVVHGHTHFRRDDVVSHTRVINPGSATRPRDGLGKCVAKVHVENGTVGPSQFIEL